MRSAWRLRYGIKFYLSDPSILKEDISRLTPHTMTLFMHHIIDRHITHYCTCCLPFPNLIIGFNCYYCCH